MNWNVAERDWKNFRAEVSAHWNRLTSEQLTSISGSRTRLASALRQTYGISDEVAERQIRRFEELNKAPRMASSR
jgi:hypothetical protein